MNLVENNNRMCCIGAGGGRVTTIFFIYSLYTHASLIPFDGVGFGSALFSYVS